MNTKNTVALVTGATTGIGFSIARKLRDRGVTVIATGVDASRIEEASKALGKAVTFIQADFRDRSAVDRLFANIATRHCHLDMLFANAGVGVVAPLEDVMDRLFAVNFKGVYVAMQKAVPLMSRGASITLTTSFLNETGTPGFSVLSATKAAVRSLARSVGAELAPRGIRVNAVSPGPIGTPFHGKLGLDEQQLKAAATDIEAAIPLGRFGEADEVADAAIFLGSPEASFITGTELVVDGGLSQF